MFPDMMLVITMILTAIRVQSCVPPVLVWDRHTEVAALLNCGDGTGSTDKSLTATVCTGQEQYQASLNLSLTNRLFAECDASCVYNIAADDTQAFLWNSTYECWMPNSHGDCLTRFADHYASMTDHLENTLCRFRWPTNAPTEQPTVCIELVQVWDQATESAALEDCVNGTGKTDKSLSASMCENQEHLQDSLNISLANRLFLECDSRCVYNIDAGDDLAFLWNNPNQCWRPKSEGLCFLGDDFSQMTEYIQNLCTLEPTPAPSNRPTEEPTAHPTLDPTFKPSTSPTEQPTVCVELVLVWNQDTAAAALEECVDGTGVTDKNFSATMCSGKEQYQGSLDLSLANRLWPACDSRCVYNIHTTEDPAFLWNNPSQCWRPKSDGLCIESEEFPKMTDYIENTLCGFPTMLPTVSPSIKV